jgi:hypothetical protein
MPAKALTLSHNHIAPGDLGCRQSGTVLYQGPANSEDHAGKTITVRLADCDLEKELAEALVNEMYSGRGYGCAHQLPSSENCVTFTASLDDYLIGTLTLKVDSSLGLTGDDTFRQEIDALRSAPGARLCELTKFAFDPSTNSRPILAYLFHIIYIYGSYRYNCSDLLIEVNPRHVRFYEAMLGFRRVGLVKTNPAVNAPAQLMWLEVAEIERRISQQAGDLGRKGHSLYRHFFSGEQERGILSRIGRLEGDGPMLTKAA